MSSLYVPLYNRYSMASEGWQEQDADLYFEFTVGANTTLLNQVLRVPPDGDFYWRGLIILTLANQLGTSGGDVKLLFKDAYGNPLQNVNTFFENIGTPDGGALSAPIFPEVPMPANGYLTLDLVEYLGVQTQVEVLLVGVTRWQG